MKKLLVVLLALTCLSALAFADDVAWTYGVTVKTGAQITMSDSAAPGLAVYDADDSAFSRVRFDAEAALGDSSAHIRIGSDDGTIGLAKWWVNQYFMDKMIALRFGKLTQTVTDTVNKGWGGLALSGGSIVVTPMSGLDVGLSIPAVTARGNLNEGLAGIKVGVSYTMTDMFTLKATYMNAGFEYAPATADWMDETFAVITANEKNNSDFAVGVAVLAVPNLTAQLEVNMVNIGMKDSIFVEDVATGAISIITGSIELFENFEYTMGPLVPGIEFGQMLWTDKDFIAEKTKMGISFKPKVTYTVMDGFDAGLSVAYSMNSMNIADALAGGDGWTDKLVVDPSATFKFNDKAKVKIDAAFTVADVSDTSVWSCPININFMFKY